MDRCELVRALNRAGVADPLYEIPGVHEPWMRIDAFYVLRRADRDWTVGLNERGTEEVLERFPTEEGACRYLFELLVPPGGPPPPGPGSAAEVLRHADEIQRQAWEQFRQAGGPGPPDAP